MNQLQTSASQQPLIMITGANGFVGRRLSLHLHEYGFPLRLCTRRAWSLYETKPADNSESKSEISYHSLGDFTAQSDWSSVLQEHSGVPDVLIHCAARVHVMNDTAADPLAAFRAVNRDLSLQLAQQAAAAGVKQFIYLSSVKVNGEQTQAGLPFRETDTPAPSDPYGISKYEAEQALLELGARTGMAVTIVRPPLVYGEGVAANFRSMLRWVRKGIPLPLGAIKNARSLVYVGNLVDFIRHCIGNQAAAQQCFLISDDHDLSTTDLLKAAAQAQNCPARLLPVPSALLYFGASLIGKRAIADRLCGSLQVDISKAKKELNWKPPYSVEDGLRDSVQS